jgi:hypothetical protein
MKVFISHSMEDADPAKQVAGAIREAGLDVFDLYTEVLPGDNVYEKLGKALQEADAMIVLLTRHSIHAPNMKLELGYALGNLDFRDRVFPVIAAEPGELSVDEIPWILRRFHPLQLGGSALDGGNLRRITDLLAAAEYRPT